MTSLIPHAIDCIAALRRNERHLAVSGLKGSSPALLVAELVRSGLQLPLVLTASQEAAEEFCRELTFLSGGDLHADLFPAWDVAPFSASSPQNSSGRSAALEYSSRYPSIPFTCARATNSGLGA